MSIKKVFDVALDIKRPSSHKDFTVINGDTGNRIHITLTDGDEPVNLSGCRIIVAFSRSDGSTSLQDSGMQDGGVTISGAEGNEVSINLFPASFSPGVVECELQIYSDSSLSTLVTTARFNFSCRKAIINEDTVQASPEYPLLRSLTDELKSSADGLSQLMETAERAEASRVLAEKKREEAAVRFTNLSAEVSMLSPEATPTASVTDTESGKHITLGIPKGPKGDTGEQGPKGDAGSSLVILGYFDALSSLESAISAPAPGDAYGVGTSHPYDIFIWDNINSIWVNNGPCQGIPGNAGANGTTFIPTVTEDGTLSWHNDNGQNNPPSVNIKGPAGLPGPNEISGETKSSLIGFIAGNGTNITTLPNPLPIVNGGTGGSTTTLARANIGAASNPNLLDNWDFTNVINQRKMPSYYSESLNYTIDRWRASNCNVIIRPGYLSIVAPDNSPGYKRFQQVTEYPLKAGMTITASIAVSQIAVTNTLYFRFTEGATGVASIPVSNINEPTIITMTYTLTNNVRFPGIELISYNTLNNGWSATITAAKLEIGSVSTLSNDRITNIAAELTKCQRYALSFGGSFRYRTCQIAADAIYFPIPLAQTMRANPSFDSSALTVYGFENGQLTVQTGFSFIVDSIHPNGIVIQALKSNHGLKDAVLSIEEGTIFSADFMDG